MARDRSNSANDYSTPMRRLLLAVLIAVLLAVAASPSGESEGAG